MTRPNWDETWMEVAHTIAKRAKCDRAQVGCVVVSADQSVLAASYNGAPPRYDAEGGCTNWCPRARGEGGLGSDYGNCPAIHAEVNAVARADNSRLIGATLYSTRSCCIGCAKTIAASAIVRVVHVVDESEVHLETGRSEEFLRASGVEVIRW